jgi:hypothetical protein
MHAARSVWLGPIALVLFLHACDDVRFTENPIQIDTFQQTPNPMVDILWVVDNSGTMADERQLLGERFDQFMTRLLVSDADYHIGIISTDTDDANHSGRLQGDPRVISRNTADPQAAFAANVMLPETDSRTERGLDAMYLALSEDLLVDHNAGFLRAAASLFVIVVSDEDDHSMGRPKFYSRWLDHFKGAGNENQVNLSAIVGQAPDGCAGAEPGARYLQVQVETNGLFHSICSEDYGPVVEELGINAAGLRRKFYLSEMPQQDTIQVLNYVADDPACQVHTDCAEDRICAAGHHCATKMEEATGVSGTWTYKEGDNSIFFLHDFLPPAGSNIEVAYFQLGH